MKEAKSLVWGALLQWIAWLECDKVKVSEKAEASRFLKHQR